MAEVLLFDLNGTLLDTEALALRIHRIFGRKLSVEAWFTRVLQYSMALSLAGEYREMSDLAGAVLKMCAAAAGVRVRESDIEEVQSGMKRLPPFRDVKKALRRLRDAGFRLAVLTNSSRSSLEEQLRHAGLREYFGEAFSVDMVRQYKPGQDTYRAAAHLLGVDLSKIVMVAAHPWDLMGAARAGCRTAFVARPGKALFPAAPRPDYAVRDLNELADRLVAKNGSRVPARGGNVRALPIMSAGLALGAAGYAVIRELRGKTSSGNSKSLPSLPSFATNTK